MAISHRQLILIGFAVVGIVTVGAVTGGFSEPFSAQNEKTDGVGAPFEVGDLYDTDQISMGEDMTVWTTVQNDGSSEVTQPVTLRIDTDGDGVVDTTVAQRNVTLGPGDSETIALTAPTDNMDPGTYVYGISTGDSDGATAVTDEIRILRPVTFIVDDTTVESPVVRGDSTTVTATITNRGDIQGVQSVELYVSDGSGFDSSDMETNSSIALAPGETGSVSFSVGTADRSPGQYSYEVRTADDAAGSSLTVVTPATFQLTDVNESVDVVRGETATLTGTVTNVGDVEGTETVSFTHGGETFSDETVTLSAGESTDVSLTVETANLTRGNYTYSLSTADDNASTLLRVRDSEFTVTRLAGKEILYIGDPMVYRATIVNTGDAPDTQTVEFKLDLDGDDQPESYGITQNVTLEAGANTTVVFDVPYMDDPDPLHPVEDFVRGTFIYSVQTDDSSETDVFVAKSKGFGGSGGSGESGDGSSGDADSSDSTEVATLDEVSIAKYGLHYDEISNETQKQLLEIFERQPFADGLSVVEIKTREEIARQDYGLDVGWNDNFDFTAIDIELQQEIEADFDSQFLSQEGDKIESWDELAQAQYGTDYDDLSDEEQDDIRDDYQSQFE